MTAAAADRQTAGAGVRAVLVIAERDLRRQVRRPGMLVSNAVQILFFVVIYAVGFGGMVGPTGGISFGGYVLPGIVAIQVASFGLSTGLSYAWDRDYGVLREMLVAPVPRMCLPGGKIVSTTALVTVQSVVLLSCAPLFGLSPSLSGVALTVAVYALGAVVFSLLGLLLATLLRRMQTLQSTVQIAMVPMMFLSGAVLQPDAVPPWLASVIGVNPLTYLVDLARHVLIGPGTTVAPAGVDLAVLFVVGVVSAVWIRARIGR